MQEPINVKDIQGIIIRGYSQFPAAEFLLLSMKDATLSKKWLSSIVKNITPGNVKPKDVAAHIAFTFAGLKMMGLSQNILDSFPIELEDRMTTKHKQFFLGDYGDSDPANWDWGSDNTMPVHVLLMLYAKDTNTLASAIDAYKKDFDTYSIQQIQSLGTTVLYERKEHFGFHDGISQPTIEGLNRKDSTQNLLAAGEFILGYKNEYGQYTPSPFVPAEADQSNLLPTSQQTANHDLGLNGSYLVFRQLKQDVSLFWKYIAGVTKNMDGSVNEEEMIKLSSQMVGRWPNGTPVTCSPDQELAEMEDKNDFDYRHSDPDGLKCPVASHVRRSNPRDALDTTRPISLAISKKHRLLRRGRSYGPPLTETLKPIDCYNATKCDDDRGLHFISINAEIGRQFEFVQNAWVNNIKFNGLHEEADPLVGNHHNPQDVKKTGSFCVHSDLVRKRMTDVPEFVQVKGGAYFFIPGIRALTFLANF
ncbi:MAG TPA: Dyp-type peroxidase [Mucilaginibacter sp.]